AAKRLAREAEVPVVEEGEPAEIGFPLVVKSAAGGGGRGMRVVREPAELDEALAAARREAKAAFGVDRVFCERYVEPPRHGRIQVEHPVTEEVTGVDLVREQLRIAEGGGVTAPPPLLGHAVEVRLYAEDPRTFLPQTGRIERLRLPTGIRVESGVAEGDEVGVAYDPMIAKLIARGGT